MELHLKKSLKYSKCNRSSITSSSQIEQAQSPRLIKSKKYDYFKRQPDKVVLPLKKQKIIQSIDCFDLSFLRKRMPLICSTGSSFDSTIGRNCTCKKIDGYCQHVLRWLRTSPKKVSPLLNDYYRALNNKYHKQKKCHKQIDLDLSRTYPQIQPFRAQQFQKSLRRVLITFDQNQIDYLQGMNMIVAIFLHHTTQQLAYKLLCKFVLLTGMGDVFTKSNIIIRDLTGIQKHCRILQFMVNKLWPRAHSFLSRIGIPYQALCSGWLLSCFATLIPVNLMRQVFKGIDLKGFLYFYQIALNYFKIIDQRTQNQEDDQIVAQLLSRNNKNLDFQNLIFEAQHTPLPTRFIQQAQYAYQSISRTFIPSLQLLWQQFH